jgi:hypothetical protein
MAKAKPFEGKETVAEEAAEHRVLKSEAARALKRRGRRTKRRSHRA